LTIPIQSSAGFSEDGAVNTAPFLFAGSLRWSAFDTPLRGYSGRTAVGVQTGVIIDWMTVRPE